MALKVLMPFKDKPKTGKGKFFKRLTQAFDMIGVDTVHDPDEPHDVYLSYNSFKWKTKKPKVLRLNGVYHNTAVPYKKMNREIRRQVKKADGVIYQSEFCRTMHDKYVGLHKNNQVIFNGAFLNSYMVYNKNDIFLSYGVALARWRPHKRLHDIKTSISKTVLFLRIFKNEQKQDVINGALYCATTLIHLCWFDSCPNSIVEALAVGCPVITNNVGGSRELIKKGCGKIVEIDEPYDYKPVKLYKPPPIDHEKVAEAIRESLTWPRVTNNSHIDIINIAKQYKGFLESVC